MSNNIAMYRQNYHYCLGMEAPSASDVEIGDALQYDRTGSWGLLVKKPVTAGLHADFAGIAVKRVLKGEIANQALAVMGVVPCKFKNHASAEPWTFATPVNNQKYLTYSPTPTNIILLTDQTEGTDEHGPTEANPPVVMIMPNTAAAQMKWVEVTITDVDTASDAYAVIPEPARIITAMAITAEAVTTKDNTITFAIGATAIEGLEVVCGTDGAATNKLYTGTYATGDNVLTAPGVVKVSTDGEGDAGGATRVFIGYIPY
jgi:hypothetical protein